MILYILISKKLIFLFIILITLITLITLNMNKIILQKWLEFTDVHFIDIHSIDNYSIDISFFADNIFITPCYYNSDDQFSYIEYIISQLLRKEIIDKEDLNSLYITTLILLKRLTQTCLFTKNMFHNTIIGLFIIAEKINNDDSYNNYSWAKIHKISINQINMIEKYLLCYLNYKTFIHRGQFLQFSQILYN